MKNYLMPLSKFELKRMTDKEKLEYLVSYPCYQFLTCETYAYINYLLNNWEAETNKFSQRDWGGLGVTVYDNLALLGKVKMGTWESKIAKNLKAAMADIKK
jgi:hypothetical protein